MIVEITKEAFIAIIGDSKCIKAIESELYRDEVYKNNGVMVWSRNNYLSAIQYYIQDINS